MTAAGQQLLVASVPASATLTTGLAGCFVQAECMDPMFRQVMEARCVAKEDNCESTDQRGTLHHLLTPRSVRAAAFLLRSQVGYLSTLQIGLTKKPGPRKRNLAPTFELLSTERACLWRVEPFPFALMLRKRRTRRRRRELRASSCEDGQLEVHSRLRVRWPGQAGGHIR